MAAPVEHRKRLFIPVSQAEQEFVIGLRRVMRHATFNHSSQKDLGKFQKSQLLQTVTA
jgi:hypothetical protein